MNKGSTIVTDFINDFEKHSHEFLVSKWILEKTPYIFDNDVQLYLETKLQLSNDLQVDSCSIIFVGSACTGFSMSPQKHLKPFDENSDIDIAIISHYYFDVAWRTLQNINPYGKSLDVQKALKEHKNRLVYWGTIATDKILGMMPFGKQWLSAIANLKQKEMFEDRDIKLRLYRDHESLRMYHINNFKQSINDMIEVEAKSITLS